MVLLFLSGYMQIARVKAMPDNYLIRELIHSAGQQIPYAVILILHATLIWQLMQALLLVIHLILEASAWCSFSRPATTSGMVTSSMTR